MQTNNSNIIIHSSTHNFYFVLFHCKAYKTKKKTTSKYDFFFVFYLMIFKLNSKKLKTMLNNIKRQVKSFWIVRCFLFIVVTKLFWIFNFKTFFFTGKAAELAARNPPPFNIALTMELNSKPVKPPPSYNDVTNTNVTMTSQTTMWRALRTKQTPLVY